jgi:hypothetical protein
MKESQARRLLWIFSRRSLRARRVVNACALRFKDCTSAATH